MSTPPVTTELRRGVLFVTLDTPGRINVLTAAAAAEIVTIFDGLGLSQARAVVLQSAKPTSFMNGTSLLLAGALQSEDDVPRATAPARKAYQVIRECAVPTIAAIAGTCYGCGVELALQCHYRVAKDSFDTQFYMTEISDYLFIPTFGGTRDIPRLVGLGPAADFVLWGERWSARQAFEARLVDECFPAEEFSERLDDFVNARIATSPFVREVPSFAAVDALAHRARIERLPEDYRPVYSTCLDLMTSALSDRVPGDTAYSREAIESAKSVLAWPSRAAVPFFFLREMAHFVANDGGLPTGSPAFAAMDDGATALCADLVERSPAGAPLAPPSPTIRVHTSRQASATSSDGSSPSIFMETSLAGAVERPSGEIIVYAPLRGLGIDIVEVASPVARAREAQTVSRALAERRLTVVRTRPGAMLLIDDIISAWLAPQAAYLCGGGSPERLARTLRAFGFTRFAGDWVQKLDLGALEALVHHRQPALRNVREALQGLPSATSPDGDDDPTVLGALLVSLGAFAIRALADHLVSHVSFLDVAARDVLDFPLGRTSLCRYFTPARARQLLAEKSGFEQLVSPGDLSAVAELAQRDKEFYRGHSKTHAQKSSQS